MFSARITSPPPAAASPPPARGHLARRLHLAAWRGRWWLAAAGVVLAARVLIPVIVPDAAPTVAVIVAARALPPGELLEPSDLTVKDLPTSMVPTSAFQDTAALLERTPAVGIPADHIITEEALVGAGLASSRAGTVVAPVPLADARLLAALGPGVVVDVLAADGLGGPASVVAARARVAAVPAQDDDGGPGATVLVEVTQREAQAMAGAGAHATLSVVLVG